VTDREQAMSQLYKCPKCNGTRLCITKPKTPPLCSACNVPMQEAAMAPMPSVGGSGKLSTTNTTKKAKRSDLPFGLTQAAESLWSSLRTHSGEGVSSPVSPKISCSHICNRNAPSMSENVGVTLLLYQGRSRWTWEPSCPSRQYHRIVT